MKRECLSWWILGIGLLTAAPAAAVPAVGEGPCKEGAQCASGTCVQVNGDSYCSKVCGGCPSGMYCDGNLFGHLGLKVCLKGRATQPVQPRTPPTLPCQSDGDCESGLVCAELNGARACTRPCATDAACKMPKMPGMAVDFFECAVEPGRDRKVCLPKVACQRQPMSCVKLDATSLAETARGMHEFAKEVERGMPGMEDPAGSVVTPKPAAAAPNEKSPKAMGPTRFAKLLQQVKAADFADEKALVLKTAAKRNHFDCSQLARVVAAMEFGDEKISAVRIMAPRLVDPDNAHEVLAEFEFAAEKRKAAEILNEL
jgi:hypothetical protein